MADVGYDPNFLTVTAPLPAPPAAVEVRELAFTHFTVLLQPDRRLAVVTGVNLDGAQLLDLDRGDDWHLDPRVAAAEQVGPELYADNDFDRGHLVRRRDPVWGDSTTATQANLDSFTYVNAAPQAALFNQGPTLWAGLEDYLLDHARTYRQRLSVYTAPVLADDDPTYRGVQIPRRYWKIAAWTTDTEAGSQTLAATGYLLDQTDLLPPILQAEQRTLEPGQPPPLGAYRTFQVPLVDIATLTGLDLGPLLAADLLGAAPPVPAATLRAGAEPLGVRWRQLRQLADQQLQPAP